MTRGLFNPCLFRAATGTRALCLLALLLAAPCPGYPREADTSKTAVNVGLHAHYGFIIPHSATILALSHTFPRALEADLSFHFTGPKAWQYLRNHPRLGVALLFTNFGNRGNSP